MVEKKMKTELIAENGVEAKLIRKVELAHENKEKIVIFNSKELKYISNLKALPYVVQSFTQRIGDRTNIVLCIA